MALFEGRHPLFKCQAEKQFKSDQLALAGWVGGCYWASFTQDSQPAADVPKPLDSGKTEPGGQQKQAGRAGGDGTVRVVVEQHMCLASDLWPCRNMGPGSTACLVLSKETTDKWGFNFEAELTSNKIQTQ